LFTRTRTSTGIASASWSRRALAAYSGFPGRPDDDPANLVRHLSALGATEVVGHPLIGATRVTKVRVQVVVARLSAAARRGFALDLAASAVTEQLTIWELIDPSQLVRRVQYRDVLVDGAGHPLATVTAIYVLSHFNEGAPVLTPPATLGRTGLAEEAPALSLWS
jgi:hypothetical protein